LKVKKIEKLKGKVSAIYELYTANKAIFTYRDRAEVGFLDTDNLKLTYRNIDEPIEDYFIDPFDKYLIATSRGGKVLRVYEIDTLKKVFEHPMKGMPHLFSATYFYKDGNFYFATPHLRSPYITIWKMYNWGFEKKIDIGKRLGFFVAKGTSSRKLRFQKFNCQFGGFRDFNLGGKGFQQVLEGPWDFP